MKLVIGTPMDAESKTYVRLFQRPVSGEVVLYVIGEHANDWCAIASLTNDGKLNIEKITPRDVAQHHIKRSASGTIVLTYDNEE
jgi:hypothetical protein